MFGVIPKKPPFVVPAGDGGALAPYGSFPTFVNRLRDEFEHLFDRFAGKLPGVWEGHAWKWGIEVKDEEKAVIVRAEAPGFEPGDFEITLHENYLILKAVKKIEKEEKKGKAKEVFEHKCYESVLLPPGIDKEKVAATYHSGVLTVTLPKTPAALGKRVPIQAV